MRRIFAILRLFWGTSLAAELEYRLNFVCAAITSLGNFIGSIFTLSLMYQKQYEFEGWPWEAALLVMGLFTFLDGVTNTFLSPNLSRIVQHVQRGTLDFILLKPLDAQLWLSLRNVSPWGLPNLAFGVILTVYAGTRLGLGPRHYLLAAGPVALSVLILYALWYLLATTTIWFTKIYNITEVLRTMTDAARFPRAAYPVVWQFVFTFIIPVLFLTTVPAEAMRRGTYGWWVAAEAILAAGLLILSRAFWRFALRSYTSASS